MSNIQQSGFPSRLFSVLVALSLSWSSHAQEALDVSMVDLPAGQLTMQSKKKAPDGGSVRRQTAVSAFSMSACEISYATWKTVHDWGLEHGYTFNHPGQMGSHKGTQDIDHVPEEPVFGVDWYDCVLWCNAASEMEGLTPCYYTDEEQTTIYREGSLDLSNAMVRWDVNGYRLPTEAEWEYACAWGREGFPDPDGQKRSCWEFIQAYGWDQINSEGRSHSVGKLRPNTNGFYDIYGNAHEWLWDRYRDLHDADDAKDPRGPLTSDPHPKDPDSTVPRRLARGMLYGTKTHPCSKRYGFFADGHDKADRLNIMGFRIASSINFSTGETP